MLKRLRGGSNASSPQQGQNNEYISEQEAKQIALAKVPGATDTDIFIYLDYDDGYAVYEGQIIYDGMEYEFEIRATDGVILDWDADSVYD